MADTIIVMDPNFTQGSWSVKRDTWDAFREAFRVLVQSHTAEKIRQNHMGKKSFRALKRLHKYLDTGRVSMAIVEAIRLGMKTDDIMAIGLLLDYPVAIVGADYGR